MTIDDLKELSSLRKQAKLTQDELAKRLCISKRTLQRYEALRSFPKTLSAKLLLSSWIIRQKDLLRLGEERDE